MKFSGLVSIACSLLYVGTISFIYGFEKALINLFFNWCGILLTGWVFTLICCDEKDS
jgi:hypothetical protein